MQLRPTDLPDPVVPATSKCGIGARSAMTGSPAMFLPRISGSDMFWSSYAWLPISSDRATASRFGLGSSMPMTLRPGNGRDAGGQRRHVAGDVVGQLDDPARLDAAGRLQLVHGDDRTGADLDDVAADVEVLEHAFEQAGVALQAGAVDLRPAFFRRRREQVERGKLVIVAQRQALLGGGRPLRSRATGQRAIGFGGSATATAGRDLGGAALAARSSADLRRAARSGDLRTRLAPENAGHPCLLGRLQAEREIAKHQAGEREQHQGDEPHRARDRLGSRIRSIADIDAIAPRQGRSLRPSRRAGPTPPMRW